MLARGEGHADLSWRKRNAHVKKVVELVATESLLNSAGKRRGARQLELAQRNAHAKVVELVPAENLLNSACKRRGARRLELAQSNTHAKIVELVLEEDSSSAGPWW